MAELAGVIAAAVTPLRADLSVDEAGVPVLLDHLAGLGLHGALLFGTTGEGPSFSAAERLPALEAAAAWRRERARPDFLLLAGTGFPSRTDTVAATRAVYACGLDAAVILPAYYYKDVGPAALATWFRSVIDAAVPSDARCLLYHIPRVAGVGVPTATLSELVPEFPGRVAGLKDSGFDIDHTRDTCARFPTLAVFSGTDAHLVEALRSGAAGGITALANACGDLSRAVYDAHRMGGGPRGEGATARERPDAGSALAAARAVFDRYPSVAAAKALIADRHGLPCWPVRPPLVDLGAADRRRLAAELSAALDDPPQEC